MNSAAFFQKKLDNELLNSQASTLDELKNELIEICKKEHRQLYDEYDVLFEQRSRYKTLHETYAAKNQQVSNKANKYGQSQLSSIEMRNRYEWVCASHQSLLSFLALERQEMSRFQRATPQPKMTSPNWSVQPLDSSKHASFNSLLSYSDHLYSDWLNSFTQNNDGIPTRPEQLMAFIFDKHPRPFKEKSIVFLTLVCLFSGTQERALTDIEKIWVLVELFEAHKVHMQYLMQFEREKVELVNLYKELIKLSAQLRSSQSRFDELEQLLTEHEEHGRYSQEPEFLSQLDAFLDKKKANMQVLNSESTSDETPSHRFFDHHRAQSSCKAPPLRERLINQNTAQLEDKQLDSPLLRR